MERALVSLTSQGDARIVVSSTGDRAGTIDRICLHRWGAYRPDGTRVGIHPSIEAALSHLTVAADAVRSHPETG